MIIQRHKLAYDDSMTHSILIMYLCNLEQVLH